MLKVSISKAIYEQKKHFVKLFRFLRAFDNNWGTNPIRYARKQKEEFEFPFNGH